MKFPPRLVLIPLVFSSGFVVADDFSGVLESVVKTNPKVERAVYEFESVRDKSSASLRDLWTPNLQLNAKTAVQNYRQAGSGTSTDQHTSEVMLRASQLITDFGAASAKEKADFYSIKQKEAHLKSVEQDVLLAALNSFIEVKKANSIMTFADQSKDNISEQTRLESVLVEKGKGYSSDVLQAKTQLAGAHARLNSATSSLDMAVYRFESVYRDYSDEVSLDTSFQHNNAVIPNSLSKAIELSKQNNPRIKVGYFRSKTLSEKITRESRKNFLPELKLVGQVKRTFDENGKQGTEHDDRIGLELNYPLNLGMSGVKHVDAAMGDHSASVSAEKNTIDEIMVNVRMAWRNYQMAVENSKILENKVNIAAEYLKLAQIDRQNKRRTLLDVLSAETTLTNSQSELAASKAQVFQSTFSLLHAMGVLDIASVNKSLSENI